MVSMPGINGDIFITSNIVATFANAVVVPYSSRVIESFHKTAIYSGSVERN